MTPATHESSSLAAGLRIQTLNVHNFRAFLRPGRIVLGGKNLLVYGENGAGKSSIYIALRQFFARRVREIDAFRNVFADDAVEPEVSVEFSSGVEVVWARGESPRSSADVAWIANASAFLDYQSLLKTNFSHGDGDVNLFDVVVDTLLHDYRHTPGSPSIGERWEQLNRSFQELAGPGRIEKLNTECVSFSRSLRAALESLKPKISELLGRLTSPNREHNPNALLLISLEFAGVTFRPGTKTSKPELVGRVIVPRVSFHSHMVERPQLFLNEARLSALGLAIYLAGRLVAVPDTATDQLKLLVLDDVLIGLDHSNRLPLLTLLRSHFEKWQIVLLTHDRVWYELARDHLRPGHKWAQFEMFEQEDVESGFLQPFLRNPELDQVTEGLKQAKAFLMQSHYPAAANYTRSAFEAVVWRACEKKRLKLSFKHDVGNVKLDEALAAVDAWLVDNGHQGREFIVKAKALRALALNPLSHRPATAIARSDIESAIALVRELNSVLE